MEGISKHSENFGKPTLPNGVDVRTVYVSFVKSGGDKQDALNTVNEVYDDINVEMSDIEIALEYAANHEEEMEALEEDEETFEDEYDAGFVDGKEFDELFEEFIRRYDTEFEYQIE